MRFKSRWLELRPLLKASSILGLVIGGVGGWKTLSIVGSGIPAAFFAPVYLPGVVFALSLMLFAGPLAFASAVCLALFSLSDDQNDVLGFLSFMGSITALAFLPFFVLFST